MKRRANPRKVLVAGIVGTLLLISLGVFQLYRLQWKEGLLADIAARENAPPISLSEAMSRHDKGEVIDFTHATAKGRFASPREFQMLTTFDGKPGWQIITPVLGDDGVFVLVNRGVVPDELRNDETRHVTEEVTLNGVLRTHTAAQGLFSPDNEPEANIWYWWDVPAMLGHAEAPADARVAPFVLHLLPAADPATFPRAQAPATGLRNNHLNYAITWFGLAAVCAVMTGLFMRAQSRET